MQFATRVFTGAVSGGAIGASGGVMLFGALLGAVGAVGGTFAGAAGRAALAAYFDDDRTAGFLEDVVAISAAFIVVVHVA